MAPNPGSFEYWRRGQAPSGLKPKASSGTLEYWRRGGSTRLLAKVATALAKVQAYFVG